MGRAHVWAVLRCDCERRVGGIILTSAKSDLLLHDELERPGDLLQRPPRPSHASPCEPHPSFASPNLLLTLSVV